MEMKRIKIAVTKQDITKGVQRSPAYCPIACAIRRRVKPIYKVAVGNPTFSVNGFQLELPPKATKFISDYDFHVNVKPIYFDISVPDEWLK